MSSKWFFRTSLFVFLLSLLGLATVFFSTEEVKSTAHREEIWEVSAMELQPIVHPLTVKVFGYAQASHSYLLKSPFQGKVEPARLLHVGLDLALGEPLFYVERELMARILKRLTLELEEMDLLDKKLLEEKQMLEDQLQLALTKQELLAQSVRRQKETVSIQRTLFSNHQHLHQKGNVSDTTLLKMEQKVHQMELQSLDMELQQRQVETECRIIEGKLQISDIERKRLRNQKKQHRLKIKDAEKRWKESIISVPTRAKITELFIKESEDVTVGTPLARLHALEEVEIEAALPDIYFPLAERGGLFATDYHADYPVIIRPLNVHHVETELEGKIKGVGGQLNRETRSLPLLISYSNIPTVSLLPGMYCEIEITLFTLKEAFRIPKTALQRNHTLFSLHPLQERPDLYRFSSHADFTVEDEEEDHLIITFPENGENALVVTTAIHSLPSGQVTRRVNGNNE